MKQKNKPQEMKNREEKIIEFVKNHPYCSRDSIFTKGKIPKSKATIDLLNNLVLQEKILTSGADGKKYLVGISDFIKAIKFMFYELDDKLNGKNYNYEIKQKFREFLWTRFKVLRLEAQQSKEFDYLDTLYMITTFSVITANLTKLGEVFLLDILDWAIKDDKYYLKHQSHASSEKLKPDYYKTKEVPRRRGIIDLLDMKKKGMESRYKYGLKSNSAYNNLMMNLGDDPINWFNRIFVEKDRILYKDTSKLKKKIYKKILNGVRLKKDDPNYEIKKKLLDSEKKTFPHISTHNVSEILSPKLISFIKSAEINGRNGSKPIKFLEICILNVIEKGLEENHMRRTVEILTENT